MTRDQEHDRCGLILYVPSFRRSISRVALDIPEQPASWLRGIHDVGDELNKSLKFDFLSITSHSCKDSSNCTQPGRLAIDRGEDQITCLTSDWISCDWTQVLINRGLELKITRFGWWDVYTSLRVGFSCSSVALPYNPGKKECGSVSRQFVSSSR